MSLQSSDFIHKDRKRRPEAKAITLAKRRRKYDVLSLLNGTSPLAQATTVAVVVEKPPGRMAQLAKISLVQTSDPTPTDRLKGIARDGKLIRHGVYATLETAPAIEEAQELKGRSGPSPRTLRQVTDEDPAVVLARQERVSGYPDSKRTLAAIRREMGFRGQRQLKLMRSALGA